MTGARKGVVDNGDDHESSVSVTDAGGIIITYLPRVR